MRITCATLLVVASYAVTAQASGQHYYHNSKSHKIYIPRNIPNQTKAAFLKRAITHDNWVLATRNKHSPRIVGLHWRQRRWMRQRLKRVESILQAAERWGPYAVPPGWWITDALCVHGYEGKWSDSGDPYWGGMQMDRAFMSSYGSWAIQHYGGLANIWPARVQLAVSYRAYRAGRGWTPWPNTARKCGLL